MNVDASWFPRGPFSSPVAAAMADLSFRILSLSSPLGYVSDHLRFHYLACSSFPSHKTRRQTKKTRVVSESREDKSGLVSNDNLVWEDYNNTERRLLLLFLDLISLCL